MVRRKRKNRIEHGNVQLGGATPKSQEPRDGELGEVREAPRLPKVPFEKFTSDSLLQSTTIV